MNLYLITYKDAEGFIEADIYPARNEDHAIEQVRQECDWSDGWEDEYFIESVRPFHIAREQSGAEWEIKLTQRGGSNE